MSLVGAYTNCTWPHDYFIKLKNLLVSAGWTVIDSRQQPGTMAAGDTWGNDPDGLTLYSWIRLRRPSGTGEVYFYRSGTANWEPWDIGYSPGGFTVAGTDTTPPSGADTVLSTGGEYGYFNAQGNWYSGSALVNTMIAMVAQDSEPYGFWTAGWLPGDRSGVLFLALDPLTNCDPADADPYALVCPRLNANQADLVYYLSSNATGRVHARYLHGTPAQATVDFWPFSYYLRGASPVVSGASSPGSMVAPAMAIHYGRPDTPVAFKGTSRFMRYSSQAALTGDTFSLDGGARNMLRFERFLIPWTGEALP